MALTGRIGKLEDRTASIGAGKGVIAEWALKYVRESRDRLMEGRTGEIMRELGSNPDAEQEEADVQRMARHLSETYPNLDACQHGEARSSKRVHEMLAPHFEEAF